MSATANSNNLNHPNRLMTVPSLVVTSNEGLISEEKAILQAKMKDMFALDIVDFQAIKQSNMSAMHSIVNHLNPN